MIFSVKKTTLAAVLWRFATSGCRQMLIKIMKRMIWLKCLTKTVKKKARNTGEMCGFQIRERSNKRYFRAV